MKFNLLDHTGHTEIEFDTSTKEGVSDAMRKFTALLENERKVASVRTGPGTQKHVRSFDPTAEEYFFHEPLVGG